MNKIIYTLLIIISFSCISITANAEDKNLINIKGTNDCGSWVEKDNLQIRSWLLGYMSAKATSTNLDVLRDVSYQSIFLWMDKYCNENPLESIALGGNLLFYELKNKKGLQ